MSKAVIKNYTPHDVTVFIGTGDTKVVFPIEGEARVEQKDVPVVFNADVPVVSTTYGEITGLPEQQLQQDGTPAVYYIVSSLVVQAAKRDGRRDLLFPTDMVRDEKGRLIGCKVLALGF
jgi:hypothetical protein